MALPTRCRSSRFRIAGPKLPCVVTPTRRRSITSSRVQRTINVFSTDRRRDVLERVDCRRLDGVRHAVRQFAAIVEVPQHATQRARQLRPGASAPQHADDSLADVRIEVGHGDRCDALLVGMQPAKKRSHLERAVPARARCQATGFGHPSVVADDDSMIATSSGVAGSHSGGQSPPRTRRISILIAATCGLLLSTGRDRRSRSRFSPAWYRSKSAGNIVSTPLPFRSSSRKKHRAANSYIWAILAQ